MNLSHELLKFHSPGNRYVYFPMTKSWNGQSYTPLNSLDIKDNNIHLYLHLPFCRQVCTFCGCNINLSSKAKDHLLYVRALKKEWEIRNVTQLLKQSHKSISLSLGGGTPNDLHPEALQELREFLNQEIPKNLSFGLIEANPNSLSHEHVLFAKSISCNAFSFGVQDFSTEVCKNVNRHQNISTLERTFSELPDQFLKGIDLIWGLPKQNIEHIPSLWKDSIKKLRPDWISFYPLAEVPWMKTYQDAYGDFSLPDLSQKYLFFEQGCKMLEESGYTHLFFGHFIRQDSTLNKQDLYHTVSGLLPQKPEILIGLGVGAITLTPHQYQQNEKVLETYKNKVLNNSKLPILRNHRLEKKEMVFNEYRDEIIQNRRLPSLYADIIQKEFPKSWFNELAITNKGVFFLKNILQFVQKQHFNNLYQ